MLANLGKSRIFRSAIMSQMLSGEREINTAGVDSVESAMPGVDTAELIAAEFKKSDALLTVGTKKTLIVAQPKRALIGFRNLINKLYRIDLADNRGRILVWILDLGYQSFDDEDARLKFLNVGELVSRFEALRVFKDRYTELRGSGFSRRLSFSYGIFTIMEVKQPAPPILLPIIFCSRPSHPLGQSRRIFVRFMEEIFNS
jgi:hypothetical protein